MLQPIHGNNNSPTSPHHNNAAAAAHHLKKKELQNILNSHDQSYQSLQQSLNIYKSGGATAGQPVSGKYNRNHKGAGGLHTQDSQMNKEAGSSSGFQNK